MNNTLHLIFYIIRRIFQGNQLLICTLLSKSYKMKTYTPVSLILIFCLATISLFAQETNLDDITFPEAFTDNQKAKVKTNIADFPINTQVSIAVIKDGKTIYLGVKNNEGILETIENKNSVFEVGSITKVMTSTLLAIAVLNEDVSLSTEISELLGYPLLDNSKITLEQLSNHTSGMMRMPSNFMFAQMKDPNNPYIHYDEAALKTWLTEYMTTDLKQDVSNYSNLGAALLAHGLTKKLGKTYEELLQEHIFQKLAMNSSTSKLKNVNENLVKGQNANGQPCVNWEFDVLEGAGAVLSTVSDMEKFARAVLSQKDEALELQRIPTFKVNQYMDIGLGWHIINGKGGNTYYWHNGGTNGYSSSILIDVERQNAIIALSNVSTFHPKMGNIDNLTFDLMKTFN